MAIKFHKESKTFHIYNKDFSYIICVMENGQMENLYYGKRIHDSKDFSYLHDRTFRLYYCSCRSSGSAGRWNPATFSIWKAPTER